MSGNNSVVECNLAKVEVAGSNPVSRSRVDKAPEPMVQGLFVVRSTLGTRIQDTGPYGLFELAGGIPAGNN